MCAGSAISVARPCAKSVSRIDSALRSRSSWAVSSSPVASGTRGVPSAEHVDRGGVVRLRRADQDLLGADRAVALAPALPLVTLDLLPQAEDAVHERLRSRRAAGPGD